MTRVTEQIGPMLTGKELIDQLQILPPFTPENARKSISERLLALNDIYDLYYPGSMSQEIYTKIYLALYRSLQKKETVNEVKQANINYKNFHGMSSSSVIGGVDCLAIIGDSGIGKSRTIKRIVDVITGDNCIVLTKPYRKIIPCIQVQTPFDSSVKSLLLEILRSVDQILNTKYHEYAVRSKATVDNLISTVSQVALEHLGMIIVDEIQNCVTGKQGRNLVGCLTQLINSSGIAVVMVGTPACCEFFQSEMYLARRAQGLQYGALEYNEYFRDLCKTLYGYQYVLNHSECTDDIAYWLFEKCQGNVSVLVSLVHDAQEITILEGTEVLNKASLQNAYDMRLSSMHLYLQPKKKALKPVKKGNSLYTIQHDSEQKERETQSFAEIIADCKKHSVDSFSVLTQKQLLQEIQV